MAFLFCYLFSLTLAIENTVTVCLNCTLRLYIRITAYVMKTSARGIGSEIPSEHLKKRKILNIIATFPKNVLVIMIFSWNDLCLPSLVELILNFNADLN